ETAGSMRSRLLSFTRKRGAFALPAHFRNRSCSKRVTRGASVTLWVALGPRVILRTRAQERGIDCGWYQKNDWSADEHAAGAAGAEGEEPVQDRQRLPVEPLDVRTRPRTRTGQQFRAPVPVGVHRAHPHHAPEPGVRYQPDRLRARAPVEGARLAAEV